jgi:hypothetical protein
MLDNGAFTIWRQGIEPDWEGFVKWAKPWLEYPTTWAVMPDVIDGTEEDQQKLSAWLFNYDREVWSKCAPVWHMHESIDRLKYLCMSHEKVCVGSSGQYATVGDDRWHRRMHEAMDAVCGNGPVPTWLHMLRGLALCGSEYPFASADSTNVAQNHAGASTVGRPRKDAARMAADIDSVQCPARWTVREKQMDIEQVLSAQG